MSEKILLALPRPERRSRLTGVLRERGHFVLESASFQQTAALLEQNPALLIFDADLAEGDAGRWDELQRCCRRWGTACLAFVPSRDPGADPRAAAPWLAGTLRRPEDTEVLLARIVDVLTIRRLSHELDLAHQMLGKKQREFSENLRAANQIQKNLLPKRLPEVDKFHFAYRFLPCEEVGGDLFNLLRLDEETIMAYLFDVSGHGVSSAMVGVSVHQSLSPHSGRIVKQRLDKPPYYRIPAPAEVMAALEAEFPFERFEKFFTITYLLIDIATGQVRYCNAGHPPPALLRADGTLETLRAGGGLIGLGDLGTFNEGVVRLDPGDRLFLYSDGIIEYDSGGPEMFGEERFLRKLGELKRRDLATSCEKIIESLYAFGKGSPLKDDVTLLGIEYRGQSF